MAFFSTPVPETAVTSPTVVTCYDLLAAAQIDGTLDFTDGRYCGNYGLDRETYERAQAAQASYLLDQVKCSGGSRLLDIGCGHGPLLVSAEKRGAQAEGITISPPQQHFCASRGLRAHLMDYRNIPEAWNGTFSCLVANGSLEHFVQAADAVAGRTNEIYREMFAICRRLVSAGNRFATTAIHFREKDQFYPEEIINGRRAFPRGSDEYHFAMLAIDAFGGWYPEPGQLERCAAGLFELIEEEDGTLDYHWTSEYWLGRIKWSVWTNPRLWWFLVTRLLANRRATWDMIRAIMIDQSWMWQFRGDNPPMRLYRHTWQAI